MQRGGFDAPSSQVGLGTLAGAGGCLGQLHPTQLWCHFWDLPASASPAFILIFIFFSERGNGLGETMLGWDLLCTVSGKRQAARRAQEAKANPHVPPQAQLQRG